MSNSVILDEGSLNGHRTDGSLEFRDVGMIFPDGTHTLEDVSLTVSPGEFVTIVGPSGCGKSTLLRIAAGLEPRSSGSVATPGGSMGYVFQDATLLPWRTVGRNVALFAELERLPKAECSHRVAECLELVQLGHVSAKYPKQLSGGMRMRASLARTLVLEPKICLFDEPFGALDEITRERLNDELLNLFIKRRFGALFITHSIYEAVFLSTKVHVMSSRPGRIVETYDIPFEYPRSSDLRFDPEFTRIAGEISHTLRGCHT